MTLDSDILAGNNADKANSSPEPEAEPENTVSDVAIIYIVIGCLAFVSVVLGIITLLLERRKRRLQQPNNLKMQEMKKLENGEMQEPMNIQTHILFKPKQSVHRPSDEKFDNDIPLEPITE